MIIWELEINKDTDEEKTIRLFTSCKKAIAYAESFGYAVVRSGKRKLWWIEDIKDKYNLIGSIGQRRVF